MESKHELNAGKVTLIFDISFPGPPHLHERRDGGSFGNANMAEHEGRAVHGLVGQEAESALAYILCPAFQRRLARLFLL